MTYTYRIARLMTTLMFAIATVLSVPTTVLAQRIANSVTIIMKDSTVRSVVSAIARQANLEPIYSTDTSALTRRITVNIRNATVADAFVQTLNGTGLVAKIASDGQTVMIRPRQDSVAAPGRKNIGTIRGRILDSASGRGVGRVTVTVQGTSLSALTNDEGRYSINNVPPGEYSLFARLVGYTSARVPVVVSKNDTTTVNILLTASTTVLSDVVTTATGLQRKVEVGNDIVKIDADKVRERAPVRNVVDLLEAAQVPGVLVTRAGGDPGAASRIRIRGIGSVSQSNDPVVIIDGVWIDATSSPSRPSRLDDIDPATIETIEVVRGPSAATLFGQDASNGVIVITTKKGKAGPVRWNLSYNRDWGQTYGRLPFVYTGVGHASFTKRLVVCSVKDVIDYKCIQDSVLISDPNHKLLSREGTETNQRYVLQMDGGTNSVTYSIALSSGNTLGVRRTSDIDLIRDRLIGYRPDAQFTRPSALRRENLTAGFTFAPRRNLTMSLMLTGTQSNLKDNKLVQSFNGIESLRPAKINLDTNFRASGGGKINPQESLVKTTNSTIASSIRYQPHSLISINGNAGVEKGNNTSSQFNSATECTIGTGCIDLMGDGSENAGNNTVYSMRLNVSTTLPLGALTKFLELRPSIGGDYKMTDRYGVSIRKTSIPPGDRSINAGVFASSNTTSTQNALAGWFLNSTIGLFQRIYFDVGVRQDVGSAITSSKDATYPKIGGSWLVSEESFWRENAIVNSLRLRGAIGHAAVQPTVSDISGKFLTGVEFIDGRFVQTTDLSSPGNYKLQPERSVEFELGFDLDLLNSRVNLIGTYAHKENRNTLVLRTLPPSFGTAPSAVTDAGGMRKENVARVRNRNVELSATARAVETNQVLLLFNYALTLSDNQVMRIGNGITPFGQDGQRIVAGYPIASAWSRKVLGYRDLNGDGLLAEREVILSDSMVYVGWSQPRYRASYGVSLTLNNRFVIDSRFAYQGNYVQTFSPGIQYGAEDINASMQDKASSVILGLNNKRPVSDFRWNSASITYHVPTSIVSRLRSRSISVSLQGRDLGLWTNYIGRDPSVNSTMVGDSFNDDGATPPRPRLFVFDVKVGF